MGHAPLRIGRASTVDGLRALSRVGGRLYGRGEGLDLNGGAAGVLFEKDSE